jgi:hypothetical protein
MMINYKKIVARYYVSVRPQTNELHTVHKEDCPFMPDDNKRIYLGTFGSGEDAAREGQKHFVRSIKCQFCSKDHNHDRREPVLSEVNNTGYIPTENQISLYQSGGLYYFLN